MKVHEVTSLSKVDPTKYVKGDLFLTTQSIGILHNGKIEQLMKKSDVEKMIQKELKKVKKNGE